MHDLFLDILILSDFLRNWIIDMQLYAYLCSLTNKSVQYK